MDSGYVNRTYRPSTWQHRPSLRREDFLATEPSTHGTFETCRMTRRMSASLIGPSGSSTFRLSINAVLMSLAGSCFSSESAPGPLYGVFFVKELARAAKLFFAGLLVRSQSPFLRPDLRIADVDARGICTGWLSPQPCGMLRPCQAIP